MPSWIEIDAEHILPGPTKAILRASGDTAATIADAAETIATGLEAIAALIVDITDPLRVIIDAAILALKNLVNDIYGTGLYGYHNKTGFGWPRLRSGRMGESYPSGWSGWRSKWVESFADEGDDERPDFSDTAEVSALLFIAGTPSLDTLPALLAALGRLLGIKAWQRILDMWTITWLAEDAPQGANEIVVESVTGFLEDATIVLGALNATPLSLNSSRRINRTTRVFELYDKLGEARAKGTPVTQAGLDPSGGRASHAPDWIALQARDIPPIGDTEQVVKRLIGLLALAPNFSDMLAALAAALQAKAAQLRELADLIEETIETIEAIIAATGVKIVKVDSSAGIPGLIAEVEALEDPFALDGGESNSYVIGACLLAGTADLGPIAALFGA